MLDISGFTVNSKIAEGACAEIFAGVEQSTGRQVAIKILHHRHLDNKSEYKRLLEEGALGLRLTQHDNIVQTYKTGSSGKIPYVVLEYVKGKTLREIIAQDRRKFKDLEIIRLAKGLARGLRFLHNAGVCHKDLKPDNIIISDEGVVKLIDFGFAENTNSFKLFGRSLEGSPAYMAPELFGTKKPTPGTDIYAVGCTLYEAATLIQPFGGMSDQEVVTKQTNMKLAPPSIRQNGGEVSLFTEKMIMTALEKDSNKRFKSADEILLDIARNPATRDSRVTGKIQTRLPK